jgi:hypothetical protein
MGYDSLVRYDHKDSILLLLTLLLASAVPEEVECARVTGTRQNTCGLQVNCVHALCPTQELEWQAAARSSSSTAVCSNDRSAVLGEVFYPACVTRAPTRSILVLCPVLPAQDPTLCLPLPTEVVARSLESRGPPLRRATPDIPSRRAPPAA